MAQNVDENTMSKNSSCMKYPGKKLENEDDETRPKSELIASKIEVNKQIKGVSGRFNTKCDVNSLKSYVYVGPTSTQKEKMLSMRASLLHN
jgi:hypothetical protein